MRRSLLAAALGSVVAVLAAAAPASGDMLILDDPTVQNVSAYASTYAWSRRADDGRYRLVVSTLPGTPADAKVTASSVPFDPDVGPTADGERLIVYSRCDDGSSTKGCDIWAYDVQAASERRITALSSSNASEVGPSFFKGRLAFGRIAGGNGLYVADAGEGAKRVSTTPALETDLSATRVIARIGTGRATAILLARPDGSRARVVDRAGSDASPSDGPRVASPTLARYRAFWLEASPRERTYVAKSISVRRAADRTQTATRPFAAAVNGLALGPRSVPSLTSGPAGIVSIDPRLSFG